MNSNPLNLNVGDRVRLDWKDKKGNRVAAVGFIVNRRHAVCANLEAAEGEAPIFIDSGPSRLFDGRQYAVETVIGGRKSLIFAEPAVIAVM